MAGSLKPSTTKEEASYTHLGGELSIGSHNTNGSGLFNGYDGSGNESLEGTFGDWNVDGAYLLIKTDDMCNIYAYLNRYSINTSDINGKQKLKILQYDGKDYTIDVTDKYWIDYVLGTELIDGRWQKIVADLPKGQYKFIRYNGQIRTDLEWFLEKLIPYSKKIKSSIKEKILNNELIKNHVIFEEVE